jgi:8-oxo-dGTP diphosphatase
MREWTVGGAVIEGAVLGPDRPAGVLLVENLRRNGSSDWTPPGGVIEGDEPVVHGLAREVREETGLEVLTWSGPLYEIRAEAPQLGWVLRVEVHRAVAVRGALAIGDDPDGIVVAADWVADGDCADRLAGTHPWVREPLLAWLTERWSGTREFRYRVHGTALDDHAIERW